LDEKIILEYEQYRNQAETTKKAIELIDTNIAELKLTRNGLKEIEKLSIGNEILVPIGSGSFLRAEIKDNAKVIVSIGSEAFAEKSIPQAIEDLEARAKELEKAREEQLKILNFIASKLEELTPKVQEIISKLQSEAKE